MSAPGIFPFVRAPVCHFLKSDWADSCFGFSGGSSARGLTVADLAVGAAEVICTGTGLALTFPVHSDAAPFGTGLSW
jgi:hypothetical protein